MKYVCLGYIEPNKFESMPEADRHNTLDRCFDYDDRLREGGHFAGGEALQPPDTAKTLRWRDGKLILTDGPYAETREQIGGILVLEAQNFDEAVRLISDHPGVKLGPFEIRPAADLNAMITDSEERRTVHKL